MATATRPHVLIVLDGWGLRDDPANNAIAMARTPVYDAMRARYPHARLVASGEAVGLPAGQMGNSEVGHMNMGAGRIVYQDLTRIDKSIRDGELSNSPALAAAMDRCAGDRHALHLVGLVSDGGVHSHQRHLHALIEMAARRHVARVFVQVITDGRDASPTGAARYLGELEAVMQKAGVGRIASVVGRYYSMDRDKRWERTKLGYDAIVHGQGETMTASARTAVEASHAAGVTDEFIRPIVVVGADQQPVGPIRDQDSVIFFNFRADRARQTTRALALDDFDGFPRPHRPRLHYTTMTVYDRTFGLPVVFTPQTFSGNLADVLAEHAQTNLRLAETEKYAHVTYFFNGGVEEAWPGEERMLIQSPKVATYDLQPGMSADAVADAIGSAVASDRYDLIIANLANPDMVGHTGVWGATVEACGIVDACIERIADAVLKRDAASRADGGTGALLAITADHGNADVMRDPTGAVVTAHSLSPVPLLLAGSPVVGRRLRHGVLADVTPTLLELLGLPIAPGMTGRSLLEPR